MSEPFWYLASPYSKYPAGTEAACREVCVLAARLFRAGVLVYSPIAHTHAIAAAGGLGLGFEQWQAFDEALIEASHGVLVATMPGWCESAGVTAEIVIAHRLGKPVRYIDSNNLDVIGGPSDVFPGTRETAQ